MPLVATELSNRGHDVSGVQYKQGETIGSIPIDTLSTAAVRTPYWAGQWLLYRKWEPKVKAYVCGKNPDIVITDRRCMVPTIRGAVSAGTPVLGVVPGLGFTRFNPRYLQPDKTPTFRHLPRSAQLQYPFVRSLHNQHDQWLKRADNVLVVSEFLQTCLRRTYGVDSEVVRTPVVPETIRVDDHHRNAIAMINPRRELKGVHIFLDIAESMPDREFLVAGEFGSEEHKNRATALPNVTCLGWVEDMRAVYSETSLVIVPSLVEEGGPRVICEAFVNGIPVAGTTRGGIPEFIGDGGETVDPPQDISQWISTIEEIITNYERYSRNAADRAKLFNIDTAISTIETVCRNAIQ
ncbi:glycosyltransferase family 4 protein [Halovenus halobia]|uniref:glycosyltransferase family 4 protein n=1 Tax=Halovenus halobia TaxID=3396622 RepID=UPI003F550568